MNVLRESPWYQEILAEGLTQGRAEGLAQGLKQGLEQGRREAILHLLRARFYLPAEVETELSERLAHIESGAVLQTLIITAAQAESLAAFTERLDRETRPPSLN